MDLGSLLKELENCEVQDFSDIDFKDEFEMMSYVLRLIRLDRSKFEYVTKSNEMASKLLNEAKEELDKKSSLESVLEIYTKAIAHAEPNSPELARAYANRSSTCYNQGLYEDCLSDIAKSFELGYPDELKAKLYFRRVKALWGVDQKIRSEVKDAINDTRQWIGKLSRESEKESIQTSLKNFKKYSYKSFDKNTKLMAYLPRTPKNNPLIKGASNAIKLGYSEVDGRHILAARDIKVGETIMVEKAYVSIHHSNFIYSYCWYCSKRAYSSIPCTKCTKVIFCNEVCRNNAWRKFHDIECEIVASLPMDKFDWFDIMAVKLTIKAIKEVGSLELLKNSISRLKSDPAEINLDRATNYRSYSTIYNLCNDLKFMQKSDVYRDYPVRSAYLLWLFASKTGVLNSTVDDIRNLVGNELAIFLGGLILRYMNISSLNTFEGVIMKDKIKYKRGKLLGCFASYFNHSCDDNVSCNQCADKIVFRAIRNIKQCEQLFISYGPCFQFVPVEERRLQLELQYNFQCDCMPCSRNWGPDTLLPSWADQALLLERRLKISSVYVKYKRFFQNTTDEEINEKVNFDPEYIPLLLEVIDALCENLENIFCIEMISSKGALCHNYVSTSY